MDWAARYGSFTDTGYHPGMWPFPLRMRHDLLALQVNAERAGLALACPYSSSAEFEAAVIRSRRRAGRYGSHRRRYVLAGVLVGLFGTLLVVL
jgi:hypothetical protein